MLNIKKIQDTMRNDAGVNGDAQTMEQIAWILFLKLYDYYESEWCADKEMQGESYTSIIPQELRWGAWAGGSKEKREKAPSGEILLGFVNNQLFPTLKNLNITESTPLNQAIVRKVFSDLNNYMKDGYLLRDVINEIDTSIIIHNKKDFKELCKIYEGFLKTLQSAGNAGEFYTPRAVTDFIIKLLNPSIGDKVADLACGTGGFLISAYHHLDSQCDNVEKRKILESSFYGIEKKSLPYLLCATNFLINGIENPNLTHGNAFEFSNFEELAFKEKFDCIVMNPPYGGSEKTNDIKNFPQEFKSSETADLFMALIMQRLSNKGKAAVVLPDGFLFGTDNAKINLKKRLLEEFNLHLIVRLPASVFAPYTGITTNILFFDKSPQGTKHTWFYRLDMPEGIKSFGKTKAMKLEHFAPFEQWDKNKIAIEEAQGNFKAQVYSKKELEARNYNFDLCGFVSEEEEILEPFALIEQIKSERERLNTTLNSLMSQISDIIKESE
ncbi:SAM-dependent DNA methyltransferase [Helicobacter apodemus]|uniref:site-specific DNA-methyltransferase (adenine-specific) n=1 Tax=Helicobacter apodemus TaxID=135569 RepID=A0A4U8UFX0_9HELI|nr:class I SAM-dependent DNA methyltransferase [Helicobacter apodemus]TLE16176.1 SAM-dependent DNA methyltransferase [Helicobacter apodemus]